MKKWKEEQVVMCLENIPERGFRKGSIGKIKIVGRSSYYIEFLDYPNKLIKVNKLEMVKYFSKHSSIKC